MEPISIQARTFPSNTCFGCGPANPDGLRLASFVMGSEVGALWTPKAHHSNGFGFLCGGIIATLLDCHTGAVVAHEIAERHGPAIQDHPYVTSGLSLSFLRPTPIDRELRLLGRVLSFEPEGARFEAALFAGDKKTAVATADWKPFRRRPAT